MHQRRSFLVLALITMGCQGAIDTSSFKDEEVSTSQPDQGISSSTDGIPALDDMGEVIGTDAGVPDAPGMPEGLAPAGMRLLTQAQYLNAMRDILEPEDGSQRIVAPDDLQPDPTSTADFTFTSELTYTVKVDAAAADRYARSSESICEQVFANASWRDQVIGCTPSSSQDPCLEDYITHTARRAWSRPPTPEELDRLLAVVIKSEQVLSLNEGIGFVTMAIFESPNFIYRPHLGQPDAEQAGAHRYTPYETADRLALLIWNSVPDDALLELAGSQGLDTPEQVRAQAERMLDDDRATRGILRFVQEWLGFDTLDNLTKDEDIFPLMTQTLGLAMKHELNTIFSERIFVEDGDVLELLTNRRIYINEELRRIYGIQEPVPAGQWEWREVPENWDRGGLLTSPGFMAMNATRTRTSPTLRGLFILERFLCSPINPAPNDLDTSILAEPIAGESVRQWNARIRSNPQCAACHNLMDPAGLTLEFFDGLGSHRSQDAGIDIEPSGTIFNTPLADSWALQEYLRDSPLSTECLTRQLARHAIGHDPLDAALPLARKAGEDGRRLKGMILDLVSSPLFLYGTPPLQASTPSE